MPVAVVVVDAEDNDVDEDLLLATTTPAVKSYSCTLPALINSWCMVLAESSIG